MKIEPFPLNFSVLYQLVVSGKTEQPNMYAINKLLNPNPDAKENSEDQLHIDSDNCSRYIYGERAVPKKNLDAVKECSLDTLEKNITDLQLSSIDESVKCIIYLLDAGLLTSKFSDDLISLYNADKYTSEQLLANILKRLAESYRGDREYITDKSATTPINIHFHMLDTYKKLSQEFLTYPLHSFRLYISRLQSVLQRQGIEYYVLLAVAAIYNSKTESVCTARNILEYYKKIADRDSPYSEDQIDLTLYQLDLMGILIMKNGVLLPECIDILGSKSDINSEVCRLARTQDSSQNNSCGKLIFFSTDGKHTIENNEETIEP